MKDVITGVGLILIEPNGRLLVLKELKDKTHIKKKRGMLSIPFETTEGAETPRETLSWLFYEEIGIWPNLLSVAPKEIGTYHFSYNTCSVHVWMFVARTSRAFVATPKDTSNIAYHGWMHPCELLQAEYKRIEVQPILESYFTCL